MLGPMDDDQLESMINVNGGGPSGMKTDASPTTLAGYAAQAEHMSNTASGSRPSMSEPMQRTTSGTRIGVKGKGKEVQGGVPSLGNLSRMCVFTFLTRVGRVKLMSVEKDTFLLQPINPLDLVLLD